MTNSVLFYFAIGFGGFIGAILRYSLSQFVSTYTKDFTVLPVGTIFVNILGCFLLGFLYSFLVDKHILYRLWINVGVLGAFTTFSTFSFESVSLFVGREYFLLFLNIFLSCVFGFIALLFGKFSYQFLLK